MTEIRILRPASPGLERYGEDITRRSLVLIKTRSPEVHRLIKEQRIFVLNVFDEHLAHLHEVIKDHSVGGNIMVFGAPWLHHLAGEVVTLAFRIPEGRKLEEVFTEFTRRET